MKTLPLWLRGAALTVLALACLGAHADDIDIYKGTASGVAPNLLLILDNAAANDASVSFNCPSSVPAPDSKTAGTNFGFERCGLYQAIAAIGSSPTLNGNINLGLMYFPPGPTNGGQFVVPATPSPPTGLLPMDSAGIQTMTSRISQLSLASDKSDNNQVSQAMQEAWAFYQGQRGLSGTSYLNPGPAAQACAKNFVLYITLAKNNNKPQDGGKLAAGAFPASYTPPSVTLPDWTSPVSPFGIAGGKYASDPSPQWSNFMYTGGAPAVSPAYPSITTYTIILSDGSNPDYEQLMVSMANQGGGKYFVVDLTDPNALNNLIKDIGLVFNEVQAVNSVFSSPTLPVTANAQGTYLNQVYMGMFRPDANGYPRWMGNLKQYQVVLSNGAPVLGDATGAPALSSAGTGFITPTAISFWTSKSAATSPDAARPTGTAGFWANKPQGASGAFDSADGEVVEKGGVGQQIRLANLKDNYATNPSAPRNVYTCLGSSCTNNAALSNMPFSTNNNSLTATALGISNPTYTVGVGSISRNSSTSIVTVNLGATPSPAIVSPTSVVVSGSTGGQFDGSLASAAPAASGSTVTYTLPLETPPLTVATPGSYSVTGSAAGSSGVTSLTRTTNAGLVTVTATLSDTTFAGGTAAAVGNAITIANAKDAGYNGAATLTAVNGANVTFTMMDSPSVYDGSGQIYVGTNCKTSGNNKNCVGFDTVNSNPPGTAPLSGLIRGTNSTLGATGQVLMVNISSGTSISLAKGSTAKITGTNYASSTGYPIVAVGSACSVTNTYSDGTVRTYTGTPPNGTTTYTVCLDLGSSFAYVPSLTANGATAGTTTAVRQNPSVTRSIASLTRGASNCPSSNLATVTATTASAHSYYNGETVAIASANPGPNEAAYNGKFQITTVDSTHFTFQVPTSPGCTDSKSGMSITYQSSVGGIDPKGIINWVRGSDNIGDEQSPGGGITIRGSVHGDVLHSRPAVINYGGSTGVVVFYGANDGMFRAINGNQSSAITMGAGSIPAGGELWSFVPQELFPGLQQLYQNAPLLTLGAAQITPPSASTSSKNYFFDGETGVYQQKDSSGNTTAAYIFLSARRGGRLIYALDVTDPTNPKFLWKHTSADPGFSELGQTWSQPKAMMVKGNTNPVLVFGAGYDPNEDFDPPTSADTMGRGVFILDAVTGNLLWQVISPSGSCSGSTGTCVQPAGMNYAIPADVTLVDRDGDGKTDRLYAADLGGNIWRIDLEPTSTGAVNTWQATLLAAVGGTDTPKRKFFFPPDVVTTNYVDSTGHALALVAAVTGDREHPLITQQANKVVNRFYLIKDTNPAKSATGWTPVNDDSSSILNAAPTAPAKLFDATSTKYDNSLSGYYVTLQNPGEKGVNSPLTVAGTVYFSTNQPPQPSSTSCSANLGTARPYAVNLFTGAPPTPKPFDGGGLAPSPVFAVVDVLVNGKSQHMPVLFGGGIGVGADGSSSSGAGNPFASIPVKKKRTYWYRNNDQ